MAALAHLDKAPRVVVGKDVVTKPTRRPLIAAIEGYAVAGGASRRRRASPRPPRWRGQ